MARTAPLRGLSASTARMGGLVGGAGRGRTQRTQSPSWRTSSTAWLCALERPFGVAGAGADDGFVRRGGMMEVCWAAKCRGGRELSGIQRGCKQYNFSGLCLGHDGDISMRLWSQGSL